MWLWGWGVLDRGGDSRNRGGNLEGVLYHRKKGGGGELFVGLVREKRIQVTGRQERGSMQGGILVATGQ